MGPTAFSGDTAAVTRASAEALTVPFERPIGLTGGVAVGRRDPFCAGSSRAVISADLQNIQPPEPSQGRPVLPEWLAVSRLRNIRRQEIE